MNLLFEENTLQYESTCRYLGIHIDNGLKWDHHIQNLCRRLNCKIAQLNRINKFFNKDILERLYKTAILPCINYAISLWDFWRKLVAPLLVGYLETTN